MEAIHYGMGQLGVQNFIAPKKALKIILKIAFIPFILVEVMTFKVVNKLEDP